MTAKKARAKKRAWSAGRYQRQVAEARARNAPATRKAPAAKKPAAKKAPIPGIDPQPGEVAWNVWFVMDDGEFLSRTPFVVWSATWRDARFLAAMSLADLFPHMTPRFRAQRDRRLDAHRRGDEGALERLNRDVDKRTNEALRLLSSDEGSPDEPPSPEVMARIDPELMATVSELRAVCDSSGLLVARAKDRRRASGKYLLDSTSGEYTHVVVGPRGKRGSAK